METDYKKSAILFEAMVRRQILPTPEVMEETELEEIEVLRDPNRYWIGDDADLSDEKWWNVKNIPPGWDFHGVFFTPLKDPDLVEEEDLSFCEDQYLSGMNIAVFSNGDGELFLLRVMVVDWYSENNMGEEEHWCEFLFRGILNQTPFVLHEWYKHRLERRREQLKEEVARLQRQVEQLERKHTLCFG